MTERLIGAADCGGSWTTTGIFSLDGQLIHTEKFPTNPDYDGSTWAIADSWNGLQKRAEGELVTATTAVAAKVDEHGRLVQAGALTPWVGNQLGEDIAEEFGWRGQGRINTIGDMVAAAISQHSLNVANGNPKDGYATTLSSGWGGAGYREDGTIIVDEPGHEYLRDGGTCPCGGSGHAEAFITGKGILKNQDTASEIWLRDGDNGDTFIKDLSDAVVSMIARHAKEDFEPTEIRWTGSVALGQSFYMNYAKSRAARSAERRGLKMPEWGILEKGKQAGLHGAFIDARRLALAA